MAPLDDYVPNQRASRTAHLKKFHHEMYSSRSVDRATKKFEARQKKNQAKMNDRKKKDGANLKAHLHKVTDEGGDYYIPENHSYYRSNQQQMRDYYRYDDDFTDMGDRYKYFDLMDCRYRTRLYPSYARDINERAATERRNVIRNQSFQKFKILTRKNLTKKLKKSKDRKKMREMREKEAEMHSCHYNFTITTSEVTKGETCGTRSHNIMYCDEHLCPVCKTNYKRSYDSICSPCENSSHRSRNPFWYQR